jgi:hypothetical protein
MIMLRLLRRWLYRPAIRMGAVDNSRIHTTHTKNAQFISYLVESGFRQVNVDRYESGLRSRRVFRRMLFWMLVGGGAWVVIESVRALSMF